MMKHANQRTATPKNSVQVHYDAQTGRVALTPPAGFRAEWNGTDYRQIVDGGLRVHPPLTKKTVRLSLKLTEEATGQETVDGDYPVVIPGLHPDEGCHKKPAVIPELTEWYGTEGFFRPAPDTCVVVPAGYRTRLAFAAEQLCADYQCLTGQKMAVVSGDSPRNGSFFLTLASDDPFLGEEGYHISISSAVCVDAREATGAYWATRTLLQMTKQNRKLPCGEIRDYPKFRVRGFMLDVGRRPVSLAMLYDFAKTMAWYKMNDFQVHLNDNYIWLEDYAKGEDETAAFSAYEAFRLESDRRNERGESPTARDYRYTKAEFQAFIEACAHMGVHIVPEIDVPAHALSFTRVFPEYMVKNQTSPLMSKRPLTDHIDIGRPEAVDFVKRIFDEYTKGETPTFGKDTVVHIGADEFLSDYGAYRRFLNEIIPYIRQTNSVRMWGGLTWIKDDPETPIVPEAVEGVQLNLWAKNWADGMEMFEMGYQLINTIDQYVYMVPNGRGIRAPYQDLINKKKLFSRFAPEKVLRKDGGETILPAGDAQILGAAFAIWNDNIDKRASGLTEPDLFERFFDALPLMAEKTWSNGKEKGSVAAIDRLADVIGIAPGTNPAEQLGLGAGESILCRIAFDESKHLPSAGRYELTACTNARADESGLHLAGGESYGETSLFSAGSGSVLHCCITLEEARPGQILMESDAPYGTHDIRILEDGTLGFTREGYAYRFGYRPPLHQKIAFRIKTDGLKTTLSVRGGLPKKAVGQWIHNGVVKKDGIRNASFTFPLQRIGSRTDAVRGAVHSLSVERIQ